MSPGSEKKRVQFRAPRGLVDRADALAAVFETDRMDVLISAVREYLREAAHSDEVKQEMRSSHTGGRLVLPLPYARTNSFRGRLPTETG